MVNTKHIPKEELIDLYVNQKLSLNKIANIYKCAVNTVKNRLIENNIPIRSKGEALKSNFEKEKLGFSLTSELIMEKINEGMFIYQVAEFFGVNRKTITKRLVRDGIDVTQLESHQKLIMENNIITSKERWSNDPTLYKNHMERLKIINEMRSDKASMRYETAHLRSYQEYKKACARIVDRLYGKERPEGMEYDHKFSVYAGYLNGVPAPILSHPYNLRLITAWENNSKGNNSVITLEELYKGVGVPWDSSIKEIKGLTKTCANCGREYLARNKNQKFCIKSCSAQYRHKKNNTNS